MAARDEIYGEDFIWPVINTALMGARKASNGFYKTKCPMCRDYKTRCGIKHSPIDGIGINCFNCGFKTRWKVADLLSKSFQDFLLSIGVPDEEVHRLKHRAWQVNKVVSKAPDFQETIRSISSTEFPTIQLPDGCQKLSEWADQGCEDPDFIDVVTYAFSRGEDIVTSNDFYWTPNPGKYNLNNRLIIPCYYDGRLVGYSGRATSDALTKYHSNIPKDYLYNTSSMLKANRRYLIIVEGILDALSIDGIGLLGARLNKRQTSWINTCDKQKIIVADRDARGLQMIDYAISNGWSVAMPRNAANQLWENDVKDAADAVKRYGKIWTLHSIISTAETDPMKIKAWSRKIF